MAQTTAPAAPSSPRRRTAAAVCALALLPVGPDATVVAVGPGENGLGVDAGRLPRAAGARTAVLASLLLVSGATGEHGR